MNKGLVATRRKAQNFMSCWVLRLRFFSLCVRSPGYFKETQEFQVFQMHEAKKQEWIAKGRSETQN